MTFFNKKSRLPDDYEDSHARMSFGDHIEELRKRLLFAVIGTAIAFGITMYFVNDIINFVVHPYLLALRAAGYPDVFLVNKPAEIVVNYVSVGLQAGIVLASPWIIYQIWLFIAAGLYQRERRVVYKYIGPSALLFLAGVCFFYFICLPVTLNFFVGFSAGTAAAPTTQTKFEETLIGPANPFNIDATTLPAGTAANMLSIPMVKSDPPAPPPGQAYLYFNAPEGRIKLKAGNQTLSMLIVQQNSLFTNLPRLDDYLDFVTFMALVFGVAFETPMVIMILAQVGLVSPQTFRKVRKFAYFGIAVIAAVATPTPDILTMSTLMLPLFALYELGILLATIVARKPAPTPDETAEDSSDDRPS